jgi:hypothetical protein
MTATEFGVLSWILPGVKKIANQNVGNLPGDRYLNLIHPEYGSSVLLIALRCSVLHCLLRLSHLPFQIITTRTSNDTPHSTHILCK